MSKIGDILGGYDDVFAEWFEDDLLVTNYEVQESPPDHDQWDDPNEKQVTTDSPIAVSGQIDPVSALSEAEPWSRDIDADVVIFVDEGTTISDGDQPEMPYPSDVEAVGSFKTYRITQITKEGNGVLRCFATSIPYRGDEP